MDLIVIINLVRKSLTAALAYAEEILGEIQAINAGIFIGLLYLADLNILPSALRFCG